MFGNAIEDDPLNDLLTGVKCRFREGGDMFFKAMCIREEQLG
jgi:hypothetical protein